MIPENNSTQPSFSAFLELLHPSVVAKPWWYHGRPAEVVKVENERRQLSIERFKVLFFVFLFSHLFLLPPDYTWIIPMSDWKLLDRIQASKAPSNRTCRVTTLDSMPERSNLIGILFIQWKALGPWRWRVRCLANIFLPSF